MFLCYGGKFSNTKPIEINPFQHRIENRKRKINEDAIKLSTEHWIQIDTFQVSSILLLFFLNVFEWMVCALFLLFQVCFRFSWLPTILFHFILSIYRAKSLLFFHGSLNTFVLNLFPSICWPWLKDFSRIIAPNRMNIRNSD